VILHKIKRPAGTFDYHADCVVEDQFGFWLYAPKGSHWQAPHDKGTLPVDCLLLLSPGRFWVAWWVDDPADRRLEIDVCLPPRRETDGWSYIDLELDPVRHESGDTEIQDLDEFDDACRKGWIAEGDARIAKETAAAMELALIKRVEPLGEEGWLRMNSLRKYLKP
jgi:hypothetical protein